MTSQKVCWENTKTLPGAGCVSANTSVHLLGEGLGPPSSWWEQTEYLDRQTAVWDMHSRQ